jgi:tetratricopeptide (TPR) repeat protein
MKLRNIYILFVGLFVTSSSYATAPYTASDSGNAAYMKGNYTKAITFYNNFLSSGYESYAVYFNLGNSYYKTNDFPRAILNYEKAKKLAPTDADIQFNLQLANQKTVDKIGTDNQLFFVGWWNNFLNLASERGWAIICIILFCACLTLIIFYLLSPNRIIKQLSFWCGILMLILSLFSFCLAHTQYMEATTHDSAIVMTATVTVKGAPADNATQLFVIHQGAKVKVLKTEGNWVEVKLANGNQGWMLATDIASI